VVTPNATSCPTQQGLRSCAARWWPESSPSHLHFLAPPPDEQQPRRQYEMASLLMASIHRRLADAGRFDDMHTLLGGAGQQGLGPQVEQPARLARLVHRLQRQGDQPLHHSRRRNAVSLGVGAWIRGQTKAPVNQPNSTRNGKQSLILCVRSLLACYHRGRCLRGTRANLVGRQERTRRCPWTTLASPHSAPEECMPPMPCLEVRC
jgi:hypothetical protein